MKKAIFFDRDGTINVDMIGAYVTKPSEFRLIPGVAKGLKLAREAGYLLVVITNQAGIAKGLYTAQDLKDIHKKMESDIAAELGLEEFHFDHIEFCPHRSEEKCACRKPRPTMVERAAALFSIDLNKSFYIGDKDADMFCAHNAGVPSLLVLTGYGKTTEEEAREWTMGRPIAVSENLTAAVEIILSRTAGY